MFRGRTTRTCGGSDPPCRELVEGAELDPEDLGDRLTGEIVLGRAETSTTDHRVAALERLVDRLDNSSDVVAHLRLEVRVDAGERRAAHRSTTSSCR
ncbi:MAG: hypothetical protein V9G12_02260 [Microthrixaceae bacterium]